MALMLFWSCASIQKPRGGPRDRTPPKLLLATPANQTRNFKAASIRLDFDEYFKLSNQYTEITVSPAMEKQPEYKIKQKSLLINFKDTLVKNTTYVINFGKAIADVNEGNVLKNFTYVFSTGPHIDSLSISGTVINTQTQEKEKDATVMLFPIKQDSLLFGKKKPSIYATTDTAGNFTLSNLHEGDYKIYALKETSADKIYNKEDELIAFQKRTLHIDKDTSGIQMILFKQIPDKFRVVKKFDPDGSMLITFNQPLTDPAVKINYPKGFDDQKIVEISKTKDTARIYVRSWDFDSLSVSVTERGKPLDSIAFNKSRKETYTRLIGLAYNINNDGRLKPATDLAITVNSPVDYIDASRIILTEDSVTRTNFTITKDPVSTRRFVMKYRWRQEARYQLTFNEGTFTNIYGERNKRLVKPFIIDKPENYGTITLRVTVPDTAKSYIIELLNEGKRVVRTDIIKKSATINYNDFIAGKYRIRITYDSNNNGKWDTGNLKRKLYPEQILLMPTTYTMRANFEDIIDLTIPKEVISP